ncbi:hypothetical protein C2G38_2105718 [Gigaspora rosea]|uniref:Uncharacterized protein n=1 Tax=Gigaspora rosea TaxID=44941 RepID=A0A397UN40_9GLOM|nr:hypothetical protein C2G38_2105718 [Gigaspora rosea]
MMQVAGTRLPHHYYISFTITTFPFTITTFPLLLLLSLSLQTIAQYFLNSSHKLHFPVHLHAISVLLRHMLVGFLHFCACMSM